MFSALITFLKSGAFSFFGKVMDFLKDRQEQEKINQARQDGETKAQNDALKSQAKEAEKLRKAQDEIRKIENNPAAPNDTLDRLRNGKF